MEKKEAKQRVKGEEDERNVFFFLFMIDRNIPILDGLAAACGEFTDNLSVQLFFSFIFFVCFHFCWSAVA